MDKTTFKLGKEYRLTFLDHFATTDERPEVATKKRVKVVCWGRCVGVSEEYVILSHFWENDTSDNNDNIHILKSCILKKEII